MVEGDTSKSTSSKNETPTAQYQCPKLKNTNYTVCAIPIKVILEAHGLWEAIGPKIDTEVDNKKDKATIAFLYQALTEDVILQVANCKTAKELWESLRKRHVGEEKVQQARLQSLMIGFNTFQMKNDDTVDAFTAKLNGYATKAKELGKTLDESLLAFEERIKLRKGGQDESQENLLFAQGEHSGKGRRFNKRGGRSNYSRGTGGIIKTEITQKRETQTTKETQIGTKEQSNLILEEDDEPSLLMTTHEIEHEEVLLNEGQIQLGKYASGDASMWYLDNGASNHMTGVKSHFKDINECVSGRVRFGDGSYERIKGRGSILLGCRNQVQKIVSDVYYIPNLKSNILSLGKLTEIGCKIIMDGNKLTLYDKSKQLLMKVERYKNRLYSIRLQIEAPICLLANVDNQAWLWHARLGHLNFDDINKMTRKNLVEGVPRINHAGQICDACLLGKHSRTPFPNQAKFRSKNPLDFVYGDLCGPISPATHSGKKLIFLLVDDCTRFISYGINTDQGKGTTGIVFYFGESPITWCTQKQPTVALSSCESKFMAATGAACQALWLKRLLSELTGWKEERITLKVDNVSAIALVRNPVFHGRSKHIDICYHFIRECVENGHINVEHVSGELQRADILTKALPRLKFVTMRQMLGVQDLGRSNDRH
nr:zinc finger, CCHC-type [Tanacetum cinerariifolium]